MSWRRLVEIVVAAQLQPGDAPALHAKDLHLPVLVLERGAGVGDEAEPVEHEAGDRLVLALWSGEAGRFRDLIEVQRAVDGPGPISDHDHAGWSGSDRGVEFVVDL